MKDLAAFKDIHKGKPIVVCGCGESLREFQNPEDFITIGVNDVGRQFHPTYLVVVNPSRQFSIERFEYIKNSKAQYLFTQLEEDFCHPNVVRFRMGMYGGTDLSCSNVLHYTQNSPYVAVCLAFHMGASKIGLIGVDFTDNPLFGKARRHPLAVRLGEINDQYACLWRALESHGVRLFNLSRQSRMTALPKLSVEAFSQPGENFSEFPKKASSLSIVSYATTPIAGVPGILARCISHCTQHSCRCVWKTNSYGNGVVFPNEVEWTRSPAQVRSILNDADLVIIHNGKVAPEHRKLLDGKATITMAHNYMWNVNQEYVDRGHPGVVVGQYQATLPEFKNWDVVPNPVPLWERGFQPGEKRPRITIAYAPSGKHDRYEARHRLYWHSKGYTETIKVLESMPQRFRVDLEVTGDRLVPHSDALEMKRRSHIVIDECVTGSYHRSSLEGLATGCVVVNGMGIRREIIPVFQHCALGSDTNPFVPASLESLADSLSELVTQNPEAILQAGARNRKWMLEHWDFTKQWEVFWIPIVERALEVIP